MTIETKLSIGDKITVSENLNGFYSDKIYTVAAITVTVCAGGIATNGVDKKEVLYGFDSGIGMDETMPVWEKVIRVSIETKP